MQFLSSPSETNLIALILYSFLLSLEKMSIIAIIILCSGHKRITYTVRVQSNQDVSRYMEKALYLHKKYPEHLVSNLTYCRITGKRDIQQKPSPERTDK